MKLPIFAIAGSGFGLYGYLPALASGCAERIVLPDRYRPVFSRRPELAGYADRVEWAAGAEAALSKANGVVIALRPEDQAAHVDRCLEHSNIRQFVLEKPLACTPNAAAALLKRLVESGVEFRIGHNFRFTSWGVEFGSFAAVPMGGTVHVSWRFLAHHQRNGLETWKRDPGTGGGALRYYGIHLIALLAHIGYREVLRSHTEGPGERDVVFWEACFRGPSLCDCVVQVDSQAETSKFTVFRTNAAQHIETLVDIGDPYDQEDPLTSQPLGDRRVPLLVRFLQEPLDPGASNFRTQSTIRLWAAVEKANQQVSVGAATVCTK